MASPTKTSQLPFGIFGGPSWTNGRKKPKQANLGEENNMYFHPKLKRWVEKGKEEEAEREAAGPPPPPVMSSGSITSTPLSKRSLSQRYVLQPNLSISSSMASLAGSTSHTDLAGLYHGVGDNLSGPPSAIGSTTPSPPQSGNSLLSPGAYAISGPPSGGALSASPAAAFFIPTPRQSSTPSSPPAFFVPPSPSPDDSSAEGEKLLPVRCRSSVAGSTPAPVADGSSPDTAQPGEADSCPMGSAAAASANVALIPDPHALSDNDLNGRSVSAELDQEQVNSYAGDSLGTAGSHNTDVAALCSTASRTLSSAAELSLRNSLTAATFGRLHSSSTHSGSELSMLEQSPVRDSVRDSLSFPSPRNRGVDSPIGLVAVAAPGAGGAEPAGEQQHEPLGQQQQLLAREYQRLGGAAANASDGGAAISLHEGMGVAPSGRTQPHPPGLHHSGLNEVTRVDSGELAAGQGTGSGTGGGGDSSAVEHRFTTPGMDMVPEGEEATETVVNGFDVLASADRAEASSGSSPGAAALAERKNPVDSTSADTPSGGYTLYSQYYYQQYAYLYQYAQDQGYTEADAVAYAQYYAAVYVQQYEAQAPEGQLGETAGSEAIGPESKVDASAVLAAEQQMNIGTVETVVGLADVVATGAVSVDTGAAEAHVAQRTWQMAMTAVEDAGSTPVLKQGELSASLGGLDEVAAACLTCEGAGVGSFALASAAAVVGSAVSESVSLAEVDALLFSAAPLPADLTAAASAAAQHQQSAVTAAVVAAAAAVEQQQAAVASVLASADRVVAARGAAAAQEASASAQSAAAALAPQLLLGKLGQLSSAATAAVASLGASVAATAPIAAALSAAASTAAAAAVTGGSFAGLEGGLSEDDFERIMHPGDPAKLDGPLPWELPEHLRTGRKFLALCANWHSANPGRPYAPQLLLQLEQPKQQQQQAVELAETAPPAEPRDLQLQAMEAVAANGGDVALAAEGGSGSAGGAAPAVAELVSAARAEEQLSSYERACRLSEFGQPAAVLLTKQQETRPAQPPSETSQQMSSPSPLPTIEQPHIPLEEPQQPQSPGAEGCTPNGEVYVVAAASAVDKPALEISKGELPEPVPEALSTAAALCHAAGDAAPPPQPIDLGLLPAVDSPQGHLTPASTRSEDPFAGTEHVPLAQQLVQMQLLQQSSPGGSPVHAPRSRLRGGLTLEQALEQERRETEAEKVQGMVREAAPAAGRALENLNAVEEADFFEHLGEEVQKPAAVGAAQVEMAVAVGQDPAATEAEGEAVAVEAGSSGVQETRPAAPAATAAAAAIDSVVQALEQLRSSAAAGDSGAVADPAAGTALLLQIQSSLAQATEALAGMGVDVSALATLAGAPATSPMEWTPSAGHKRPRVDASPATPTRVAALGTTSESAVVTPLLPPGPPMVRPTVEEAAAADPAAAALGERFQQVGRRLSDACGEAEPDVATACQQSQQESFVMSLTVAAAPDVDVAAVEERVRGEERTAWEARVAAVVDSEREAAALVIAAVEWERDGLQQRVGDLEQALATAMAEREELLQKLDNTKGDATRAYVAEASAVSDRDALEAQLSELKAERGELVAQLAAERSEKAALAEALSSVRAESEELRRSYAERFSALNAELEATRGSLAELQGEHDELLLCLGQESTKVSALTDALRDAGGDPEPLVEQIEAEYENMGLGVGGGEPGVVDNTAGTRVEGQQEEQKSTQGAGEGWEGEDLML